MNSLLMSLSGLLCKWLTICSNARSTT